MSIVVPAAFGEHIAVLTLVSAGLFYWLVFFIRLVDGIF
jgi:hypothetical protein